MRKFAENMSADILSTQQVGIVSHKLSNKQIPCRNQKICKQNEANMVFIENANTTQRINKPS